jgi:Skp family chaperone for outer membrane proteins
LSVQLAQLTADCEDAVSARVKQQAAECIQSHWRGCAGRRRFDRAAKARRQELQRALASLRAELQMLNATVEAARPLVSCRGFVHRCTHVG